MFYRQLLGSKIKEFEREHRDWSVILLLLLLGILLMLLSGQRGIRMLAHWTVQADMSSNLNPSFPDQRVSGGGIQPLSAGILTPEPWNNTYLTPGAYNNISGTVVPFVVFNPNVPPAVTVTPVPNTTKTTSQVAVVIPNGNKGSSTNVTSSMNTGSSSSNTSKPTTFTTNKPVKVFNLNKKFKNTYHNKGSKSNKGKGGSGSSGSNGKGSSNSNGKGSSGGSNGHGPPGTPHGHHP